MIPKVVLNLPYTPYGRSKVTFNVLYPAPVLEEWEVVTEEAVLVDNLFYMYGVADLHIEGVTVEKEKTTNKYRFKSPYDNEMISKLRTLY